MLAGHNYPSSQRRFSRWPAWWDMAQGASGLVLVLFMWMHMFMVSSILLGKDAMYFVARMFEGEPLFGKPYPFLVSGFAAFIFLLIVMHAFLAMRKFPASFRDHYRFYRHAQQLRHGDTWMWYTQIITGFVLFFLVLVHLYQLMLHPADIGPYASSDRIWTGRFWPLYLVLLVTVEVHGAIGIYRLSIKWGLLGIKHPTRERLKTIKWAITAFFLILGLLTLIAYMKIGYEHADQAGERYTPAYHQADSPSTQTPAETSSDADHP